MQQSNLESNVNEEGPSEGANVHQPDQMFHESINIHDPEFDEIKNKVRDMQNEVASPSRESDLKTDLDNLELKKMNRILLATVESLEKELTRTKERMANYEKDKYLLVQSRNDLYQEKEDLIQRCLEYDYIKQKLEEREKRLKTTEEQNFYLSKEIEQIKQDNTSLKQEMEVMRQCIQKIASSKMNLVNSKEFINNNSEIFGSLSSLEDARGTSPEEGQRIIDVISSPNFNESHEIREFNTVKASAIKSARVKKSSPPRKIIRRRKKGRSKKRTSKPKNSHAKQSKSPLSKSQLKLLHDPQSYEKYAVEFENQMRTTSASKGRGKMTSRKGHKKSRNEVSPL